MRCAEAGLSAQISVGVGIGVGVRVRLAWATDALARATLTHGEAAQWRSLGSDARRHDWLLGRAALRALLPGEGDTSEVVFPHRSLSLSHAGGVAVAVRMRDPEAGTGVGIDFEPWRPSVDPRIARFFLSRSEQAAAGAAPPAALLRLWTIKEALYKATPDNGECLLLDFEVADPGAASGDAVGPRGEALRYAAVDLPSGPLAVAVGLVRPHAAV